MLRKRKEQFIRLIVKQQLLKVNKAKEKICFSKWKVSCNKCILLIGVLRKREPELLLGTINKGDSLNSFDERDWEREREREGGERERENKKEKWERKREGAIERMKEIKKEGARERMKEIKKEGDKELEGEREKERGI